MRSWDVLVSLELKVSTIVFQVVWRYYGTRIVKAIMRVKVCLEINDRSCHAFPRFVRVWEKAKDLNKTWIDAGGVELD